MGCNTSRLDRVPAVALCRDRCKFLDEALRQSYAVADAHVAHMESLNALGAALHRFFHQIEDSGDGDHPANAPSKDFKSQPEKSSRSAASPDHSSSCASSSSSSGSDSDSHVLLHSESEAEDTDKEFKFLNPPRYDDDYLNPDTRVSSAPNNVVFPNSNYYGGYSDSKPPSPPPPSSSAWDFLNFFETFERYEVPYIPSRDTHDTREEKEKEKEKKKERIRTHHERQNEGVKKGDGVAAVDGSNGNGGGREGQAKDAENSEAKNKKADSISREKNPVSQKEPPKSEENTTTTTTTTSNSAKVKSPKGFSEATRDIQILFERASDSGNPILEMLDVGKLRYHRKIAVNPVPCKMMHVFTPSIPSKSLGVKCMESSLFGRRTGSGYQGVDKDKGLSYGNLCSTLKKLCMWEKKLFDEVKAEEKLRILHEKKCKQLRRMNKKGADAHKVESVQTFIQVLATKMKISIQVVDKISNTISTLREEELWPLINTFILRFLAMWKDMLECYKCQYQEIAEAKSLDASSFNRKLSNSHLDATIQLKSEILNWNLSFSDWIYAQKSHVKALNGWLVRCLLYEPEEIPDGAIPFSPGSIGAPPVFVICTKWSRAVDNLSENNVIEAVNGFILRVNEILERHISDLQQRLILDKELERKVKFLERQEQKIKKVFQARERKTVPIGREDTDALLQGNAVHRGELVDATSLQSGLKHIFVAMEKFTATAARAYEELCKQIEQDNRVLGESSNIH